MSLKIEYKEKFSKIELKNIEAIDIIIARLLKNKKRYQLSVLETNIPWYFIGIIHMMECDGNFSLHIHNGDSLKKKTVNVPKNRPLNDPKEGINKPYTWEESCKDCIQYKTWDKLEVWDFETLAFQWERNNGFGYSKRNLPSPYLWSFTNIYSKGKFVADGVFDEEAVSKQAGCLAIYKRMLDKKNIN